MCRSMLVALALSSLSLTPALTTSSAASSFGFKDFESGQPPPSYKSLDAALATQAARGYLLFKSPFAMVGSEHVGFGPLYNATSCNECHIEGRHGEGPRGPGIAPTALVFQLASPAGNSGRGDPVYGEVLSTHAIDGAQAEGYVQIEYRVISGYYYPFGGQWSMRVPRYRVLGLAHGPLARQTIVSPRLAPQLFGLGLLEAVPDTALIPSVSGRSVVFSVAYHAFKGQTYLGRMGWQNQAVSIRDQVSRALVNEMGVTSSDQPHDDCTAMEPDCRSLALEKQKVSDQVLEDLTAFVQTLAVPVVARAATTRAAGESVFKDLGCAECHKPVLITGLPGQQEISPYTDLRLHNLGVEMADETAAGRRVRTRWRTAPLWGIAYRIQTENYPTFLHDGRARSVEEAILWHYGEARDARFRFMALGPNGRNALLQWLQSL